MGRARRWMVLGIATVVAAGLTVVVARGVADAAAVSTKVVHKTRVADDNTMHVQEATCPSGHKPIGGGYSHTIQDGMEIYGSQPMSDGWGVYVRNTTGEDQSVGVYAVCVKGITPKFFSSPFVVGAGRSATLTYKCPTDWYLVGGGHVYEPIYHDILFQASYPDLANEGWRVSAYNPSDEEVSVLVIIGCTQTKPTGRKVVKTVTALAGDSDENIYVGCPDGKIAIGGGFGHGGTTMIVDDSRNHQRNYWFVSYENPGPTDYTVNSYVFCVTGT